jgi:hypothetical protein
MSKGNAFEIVKAIRKKGYMVSNRGFEAFAARLINALYMEKIYHIDTITCVYQRYVAAKNRGINAVPNSDAQRFKT